MLYEVWGEKWFNIQTYSLLDTNNTFFYVTHPHVYDQYSKIEPTHAQYYCLFI
jgi:hypothetical protein